MIKTTFKGLTAQRPLNFSQALLLTTAYLYRNNPTAPWNRPGFCHLFAYVQQELQYLPKNQVEIPLDTLPQWDIQDEGRSKQGIYPAIRKAWNPVIDEKVQEYLVNDFTRDKHIGDPKLSEDGISLVELLLNGKAKHIPHVESNVVRVFGQAAFTDYLKSIITDTVNDYEFYEFGELQIDGVSPQEQFA